MFSYGLKQKYRFSTACPNAGNTERINPYPPCRGRFIGTSTANTDGKIRIYIDGLSAAPGISISYLNYVNSCLTIDLVKRSKTATMVLLKLGDALLRRINNQ